MNKYVRLVLLFLTFTSCFCFSSSLIYLFKQDTGNMESRFFLGVISIGFSGIIASIIKKEGN